ncbi:MAG: LacI family transcriptional regulator [Candidatus Nephthysia bennettiae]|uniref:LacI family DNA-binding transcriptional regulator n=2 Tax=Candidatus Nephthysia bennettiae TaxID=3127016 RepID=A0A934N7V5_9BACT|nr:LacI family DNA-binding transcriptional regulator [Candidatus Dormibacteraeota bacterium]MBJ7611426.1 LacI family DNA-binding transcriptional regulator [Candidatus Dormibacteraeota bacterium]PZR91619.1 MAG: LacI family transcriptional regulator [Candidatus Dormibacteraeota bacterium]
MATMVEVARRAGVSVSTVSHVINETRFVRASTREAVLGAIKNTGYVPNSVARSLTTARSRSLGLVMTVVTNPYFTEVVQGVHEEAARNGYVLLLADSHEEPDQELRLVRDLHQRRVDGIILAPSGDARRTLKYVRERSIPAVLIDRMADAHFSQVGTENLESTALLVRHLADLGHRRIGMVAGLHGLTTSGERIAGYRLGLERSHLDFDARLVVSGGSAAAPAREAVSGLLALAEPPTALVVGNNYMTIGTIAAIRDAGLSVPSDVAVVAFDDFEWADLFSPRLTTVAQPCREMGASAVRLLLSQLSGPAQAPRSIRLAPRFIHRQSCGCSSSPSS